MRARWLVVAVALAATLGIWRVVDASSPAQAGPAAGPIPAGRDIYLRDCSMCHGSTGQGTKNGPNLTRAGTASVDFMVRTGRMPLPSPSASLRRRDVRYSEADIDALVAYMGGFVSGPAVPNVDVAHADLAAGGDAYRAQCAACHQAGGAGGALAFGDAAPSLHPSTPREVVEAIRTGPGQMPSFPAQVMPEQQADDIARYVQDLHHPDDRGGINLGHLGPVPEGLVAWVLGLGLIMFAAGRIGDRSPASTAEEKPSREA